MSFVAYLSVDLKPESDSRGHQSFRCILNIRTPYRLQLTQTSPDNHLLTLAEISDTDGIEFVQPHSTSQHQARRAD